MAQPRIAAHAPVACAGCYGQYPDRTHIDYASAIEGPQVDPSDPRSPHIDWVIMCEDCVRAGYEQLPEMSSQRDSLKLEVERLRKDLEEAENYASSLEDTLSQRPQREKPKPAPKAKAKPAAKRKPRYEAKATS